MISFRKLEISSIICVQHSNFLFVTYTGKKAIMGSFIGSMKDMDELLNFWVEKDLTTMVEVVNIDYVNKAFERMERNDVRYRFVLDVAGSSNLE